MLTTKWFLHIEGGNTTLLKEFVAPNREIVGMVKSHFAEVTKLLGSTEDLVLQKISSPNYIKECVKLSQPNLV